MRGILKDFVILSLSSFLVSLIFVGFILRDFQSILYAALFLYIGNKFIHPVLQVILLPLNLLGLGIFSPLATVVSVFLSTIFVQTIKVMPFTFNGFSILSFAIPAFSFNYILSLIVISVTIYFMEKVLFWLFSK